MLICCWIYGFAFFAVYMTPFTGLRFDETCFCWAYNDGVWSSMIGHFEYYSLAPTMVLTFIIHVVIVIIVAYMVSKIQYPTLNFTSVSFIDSHPNLHFSAKLINFQQTFVWNEWAEAPPSILSHVSVSNFFVIWLALRSLLLTTLSMDFRRNQHTLDNFLRI